MFFEKSEKTLLVISSIVYIAYVVFIGGMISIFKEYVGNEYLRTKIVDQIREQTRLTQDSANVSTKDMHFIFQVMGQLAWPYFALLIVLFLLLIYVLFKKNINHNVVAFLLLVLLAALFPELLPLAAPELLLLFALPPPVPTLIFRVRSALPDVPSWTVPSFCFAAV